MKKITKFLSKHEEYVTVINGLLLIAMFALLSSCNLIDDDLSDCPDNHSSGKIALSMNVFPETWNDSLITRAAYTSASSSGANMAFNFSFSERDAIGLFAVNGNGKVVIDNQKYTYSDGTWTTESPIEYSADVKGYSFFAYYPWKASLSGAPAINASVNTTSASTFFSSAISSWNPATDQGSIQKFTASDLMVAKGTASMPYVNEIQLSFTLKHQMGLLITKDVLSYYRLGNPSEKWNETQTFSPNVPYSIGELRYFLAKPNMATTLGSKTTTVEAGQVEQLYFSNGEPVE